MAALASAATIGPAPRVSIVIPAYNRERFVGASIESVVAQSESSWELVVVDDGSTDLTASVVHGYAADDARIRLLTCSNGGVARARNAGLAATDARSRFVAFLDSDDLWIPDALRELLEALDAQPACVAAHGVATCIDDDGQPLGGEDLETWMRGRKELRDGRPVPVALDAPTPFAAFVLDNWVVTPGTMLVSRDALQRAGTFDPRTAPADDWDMTLRLSRLGDFAFVDHPVLSWRRHPGALSETSPDWRRAYFRVRDKLITDPANSPQQSRIARDAYRLVIRASWNDALAAIRRGEVKRAARDAAKAFLGDARFRRRVLVSRLSVPPTLVLGVLQFPTEIVVN